MEVHVDASLRAFFDERIHDAATARRTTLSAEVAFYLTHLLAERALRGLGEAGERPLALELAEAQDPASDGPRLPRLQAVGDAALYESGMFPERVTRRGVSRDYVMSMGARAYGAAESLSVRAGAVHPFGELAREFQRLADILDEVREQTTLRSRDDVLSLCERYWETASPSVAARLLEAGVLPRLGRESGGGSA